MKFNSQGSHWVHHLHDQLHPVLFAHSLQVWYLYFLQNLEQHTYSSSLLEFVYTNLWSSNTSSSTKRSPSLSKALNKVFLYPLMVVPAINGKRQNKQIKAVEIWVETICHYIYYLLNESVCNMRYFKSIHKYFMSQNTSVRVKCHPPYCTISEINCLLYIGYFLKM